MIKVKINDLGNNVNDVTLKPPEGFPEEIHLQPYNLKGGQLLC